MKHTTLLKVLSASAIFTAIAAIESYDHNAFATEVTTPATQNNTETKIVSQDVKKLQDGVYNIKTEALNFSEEGKQSMAAAGLDKEKTKLIVKNGQYSVNVAFKPIKMGVFSGYLGDLKYYDGNKTHANRSEIKDNEFKNTTIVENYSENEKDDYIDTYKQKFPERTVYPKTLSYNVDKNKIDSDNKLETYTQVFVPVMESIFKGSGTQRMILKFDLNSLATKTITVPKVDTEKLAKEKAEKERIENERLAKEKAEKERIEKEKLAKEKAEKERIENERLAKEKAERERIENERLAKEKAEKERIENERLAKEKAEKERIENERLAKEKAEKERIENENKAPLTAKGEAVTLDKPEFDLDRFLKNHNGPITAKGEATILDKPEFDLENYIKNQKESSDELHNSESKNIPSEIKGTVKNTDKTLPKTGTTTSTTAFFGLISLLTAFALRKKSNK